MGVSLPHPLVYLVGAASEDRSIWPYSMHVLPGGDPIDGWMDGWILIIYKQWVASYNH